MYGLHRDLCSDPVVDGIFIVYTDASNITWTSRPGNASDNFEQISLTDETRTFEYSKKWKARFSVKLYNLTGNSITLTGGEIYGPVFPF